MNGQVVRHEILHALIRHNGEIEHPAGFFLDKCGGVVDCPRACIETSEGREAPAIAPRSASVLTISMKVDSSVSQSHSADFTYVPVTLRAQNSLGEAIRVELAEFNGYIRSFGLDVATPPTLPSANWSRNAYSVDPRAGYFEPGEIKQWVFDLYIPKTATALGEWSVSGGFATNWMNAPLTFQLTP
jgi:hypothetical protein